MNFGIFLKWDFFSDFQPPWTHTILFILKYRWRHSSLITAWTVDLAVLQSGIVNNVTIIISDWKKIPPNKNMMRNPKCQHSCASLKTGLTHNNAFLKNTRTENCGQENDASNHKKNDHDEDNSVDTFDNDKLIFQLIGEIRKSTRSITITAWTSLFFALKIRKKIKIVCYVNCLSLL